MCHGSAGGTAASTQASDHFCVTPSANRKALSFVVRKRQLRRPPVRRPVRPIRCRNDETLDGESIWTTRSRSPTSTPNSSVDVATMTQFLSSEKAASACRRSDKLREAWLTKVRISWVRSMLLSCSALLRESQKTSRFSPRCRRAITVAAFSSEPTWSMVTSASVLTLALPTTALFPVGANQVSSSFGLLTVAERPMRCSGRSKYWSSRCSTDRRCQPRSSPAKACSSSTITACRLPNHAGRSTLAEISMASTDSGVVRRMSGASLSARFLRDCETSPCQTSTRRPTRLA